MKLLGKGGKLPDLLIYKIHRITVAHTQVNSQFDILDADMNKRNPFNGYWDQKKEKII